MIDADDEHEPTTIDEPEPEAAPDPPMMRARVTLLGREPEVVEFEPCGPNYWHERAVQTYLDKHGLKLTPFMPVVEMLP